MELIEPKIMLMTDGPRYVCSRCGVKYKKGLLSKTLPLPATNLEHFFLQCRRFDLTSGSADAGPSARSARKSSHKNATSPSTWKSTNGTGCGSTRPCPSSRTKFTFKCARNALSSNKHRLPPDLHYRLRFCCDNRRPEASSARCRHLSITSLRTLLFE